MVVVIRDICVLDKEGLIPAFDLPVLFVIHSFLIIQNFVVIG